MFFREVPREAVDFLLATGFLVFVLEAFFWLAVVDFGAELFLAIVIKILNTTKLFINGFRKANLI